ncbi:MAG: GTP-binding protein [Pseudomonadota bacterium]|nr:GTP-binding protein [Pseudomonadota bacterium]
MKGEESGSPRPGADGSARVRRPVFVLSGFLGAGKTSLLNALLASGALARTGVIVNEFGEIGLDHLFLGTRGGDIVEMSAGCLCCTIRGELASTLLALAPHDIDRVVIETTGLADPVPVLQAILADREVGRHFELAGLVTLVDAINAPATLNAHPEARAQVSHTDALVLTKADLLAGAIRVETVERVTAALRRLNPAAPIVMRGDEAALAGLFAGGPSPVRHAAIATADPAAHPHRHDVSRHGDRIRATVLRHDRPLPWPALEAFLDLVASAHGDRVLRLKGLAAIEGLDAPLVVHGVQGVFHEPEALDAWPDPDRSTRLVAILQDMDPEFIQRLFAGFAGIARTDTPDRQALAENPLAIPGMDKPFRAR